MVAPTPPPPHTHIVRHPVEECYGERVVVQGEDEDDYPCADPTCRQTALEAEVARLKDPQEYRNLQAAQFGPMKARAEAAEAEVERLRDAVILAVTRARNLLRSPGESQRALWSIMADDLEAALARDREKGGK